MFEALALDTPSSHSSSSAVGNAGHSHDGDRSLRFTCGAGALVQPPFARKRAALRVHAISGYMPEGVASGRHSAVGGGHELALFEYQVVFENVGCVPVEVLGRCVCHSRAP